MRFILSALLLAFTAQAQATIQAPWFGIHVVDEATGQGIPLIELRTVNDIRVITDNAGWAAFHEPGLMDREVWFYLSHHPGYEREKDGFGYEGARLKTTSGGSAEVKLKRTNIAERIARLTGQGLYRDSELLGLPCALPNLNPAGIMGQDSVQAVPYQGKIFWLWGDTNVPHYPLGNFQTTSAWTLRMLKPEQGIVFDYLTDSSRPDKLRHMLPIQDKGAVWLFGLLTIKDELGKETMLAHYSRHLALDHAVEHGLARFDDGKGHFVVLKQLDKANTWRFPRGHAVQAGECFYFSDSFLHTRVRAKWADLIDPGSYEALHYDEGERVWRWQREQPPTMQNDETRLLLKGIMPAEQARYRLKDVATGKLVRVHGSSVQWNAHRQRWVMIAVQSGDRDDPSPLGEVWYAEARAPDGPWTKAVKVVSHPRYSFYNPIHHGFLDADGGRTIYFEGTYTLEFSGNPYAPSRYNYNQLMYRLDLDDERMKAARVE
jgi:hypothetical protein